MVWQQIIGFHHVAKLQSFTKAASATFRTQSALSQQNKALEKELDCPLFERIGKRNLRLTLAGERFLKFTENLLEKHDRLIDDLNEIKGLQIGRLRIAAQFATLYFLLPEIVRRYIRLYPKVELNLLDCPLDDIIQLVNSGDIDFGITPVTKIPPNLKCIKLNPYERVLITSANHPLAKKKKVTLLEIAQYPMITYEEGLVTRKEFDQIFKEIHLDIEIIMEATNAETIKKYVEMGVGIAIIPKIALHPPHTAQASTHNRSGVACYRSRRRWRCHASTPRASPGLQPGPHPGPG